MTSHGRHALHAVATQQLPLPALSQGSMPAGVSSPDTQNAEDAEQAEICDAIKVSPAGKHA